VGTVLGTLSFGYVGELTGGFRNSILALMTYFAFGFVLLMFVSMKKKEPASVQVA
jgi:UMF1 family MFS transporter